MDCGWCNRILLSFWWINTDIAGQPILLRCVAPQKRWHIFQIPQSNKKNSRAEDESPALPLLFVPFWAKTIFSHFYGQNYCLFTYYCTFVVFLASPPRHPRTRTKTIRTNRPPRQRPHHLLRHQTSQSYRHTQVRQLYYTRNLWFSSRAYTCRTTLHLRQRPLQPPNRQRQL